MWWTSRILVILYVFLFLAATLPLAHNMQPTQTQRHEYMKVGLVQHRGNTVTAYANFPRPLLQALTAVRSEYGWAVNYEDPPYASSYDLIDATDPVWRANHPNEQGFIGIAGGSFQSTFEENPATVESRSGEEEILNKIVSDYNSGGNPGKFLVRNEGNGYYSVLGRSIRNDTGQDEPVSSILDTVIWVPTANRNADETIDIIFQAISRATGVQFMNGFFANNLLLHSWVTIGGNQVTARTLLLRTMTAMQRPAIWTLEYDPNAKEYMFDVSLAVRTITDSLGRRVNAPIDMMDVYKHLHRPQQQPQR